MHCMIPFPWQPVEDRVDLFGSFASQLPALSDIRVKKRKVAALSLGKDADGLCFGPHKDVTLTASAVCHCTQNKHVFLTGCFRCWTKQPRTGARTMARCTAETAYQCHHELQLLNTAPVFCASLLFFCCHLSLALPSSVWTDPLLVQLSR